ncbi:MAG: DNA mismatch repair protein MutS, partial [Pseudomonadales bacterium]
DQIPSITNVHLSAVEHNDEIRFMHQVQQGPASKSYGLQVAKLAGVPKQVIDSAKRKLAELELNDVVNAQALSNSKGLGAQDNQVATSSNVGLSQASLSQANLSKTALSKTSSSKAGSAESQLSMAFEQPDNWLEQKIKQIDIDDLTPREALALLYQWRKELN